jgi:small-conductance mechanosensitive channel
MTVETVNKDWINLFAGGWKVIAPTGVFVGCLIAGWVIRKLLFRWIRKFSATSRHKIDVVIVPALRGPIMIWALIIGLDLATRTSALPLRYQKPINITLEALWIASLTIIAAQLAGNLIRHYTSLADGASQSPTLTKNLTQIVVSILGFLILLNHLQVDIRPYLAALGVGGLAVALALQDTLANLFAGFYISLSTQIRIGDYVKLNTGEEGYVTDITWRSTTLRGLANNYIFIPNAKLTQAIITNFNLPSKVIGMSVSVRIAYDADTDHIEKLLIEEATNQKLAGLITDPPPSVQWNPGFGDSTLQLSLNFQVEEFVNQYGVQSELRKRIFKRFQKEGIALPYPTQELLVKPTSDLPSEK